MTDAIQVCEFTTFDDTTALQEILREYVGGIGVDISFQDVETELRDLGALYARAAGGCMLVAEESGVIVGCVALKKRSVHDCEMKRLYVRPSHRKHRLGALLVTRIIAVARAMGYQTMKLDSLTGMQAAIALYRKIGFREIEAYTFNPHNAVFMELDLLQARSQDI